jgi:hypothetical protein
MQQNHNKRILVFGKIAQVPLGKMLVKEKTEYGLQSPLV